MKGQRETYIKWQRHLSLSPARTSGLAHAVERRGRCCVTSEELGFDCIEVSVKKTRRITRYVHRHDLVRVGRRSRRPCVLLSRLAFIFLLPLFGERIIDVFLGLASLARFVLSLFLSLVFFCFLLVFRTVSEASLCFVASPTSVVGAVGESKAECHELTSSGRSCTGEVPSLSMLARLLPPKKEQPAEKRPGTGEVTSRVQQHATNACGHFGMQRKDDPTSVGWRCDPLLSGPNAEAFGKLIMHQSSRQRCSHFKEI